MRLYLMQHGHAVAKELDPDRPLSAQGRTDVQRLAAFLRQAGVQVAQVWHSGKTRAEQTATLLARAVRADGAAQARSGLHPNDPVEALAEEIADWSADTLIVGHLPFLGRLAAALIVSDADRPLLDFQPGSLACLVRGADGRWTLAWMMRPELFAEVAT